MIPPFFGWNRFVPEGFGTTCTFDYTSNDQRDRLYTLLLACGGFLVPLLIIILSYTIILNKLFQRSRHPIHNIVEDDHHSIQSKSVDVYHFQSIRNSLAIVHWKDEHYRAQHSRHTETRATRNILLICTIYCVAWGPYASMALLTQFGFKSFFNVYTSALLSSLTKVAACLNPLIYALSSSGFRKYICWKRQKFDDGFSCVLHRSQPNNILVRSTL
jgi:r-opsin